MLAESISPGHRRPKTSTGATSAPSAAGFTGAHFVAATDGNISVRLDSERILTTPTAFSKGMMTPDDLVITDMQGKRLSGSRQASSELGMHLLIYRRRPDVHAVCHAHPPIATGYAAAGIPLNKAIVSEVVLSLGCIPVAPYATPGTPELTDALEPLVQHFDALLMANHGVVTYGHGPADGVFPHGDGRAFCTGFAGDRNARQTSLAFWPRCGKIARGARPLRFHARLRRWRRNVR